jgi:hypothetical protein
MSELLSDYVCQMIDAAAEQSARTAATISTTKNGIFIPTSALGSETSWILDDPRQI